MEQRPLTVGVGAALVDLLLDEKDEFLRQFAVEKGGMTLVDSQVIENAMGKTKAEVKIVPGGSACNTLVGIGNLGGRARMIGRLGGDELGGHFRAGLQRAGVEERLRASGETATGRVLSVVTPDAQRTMFTYLGASSELHPNDVADADFADATLVHLEGYLLFNRPVVDRILALAHRHKVRVSLDLGSFQVVQICRPLLEELFAKGHVDILLANEDEARAYTGLGESESLEIFAGLVKTAVVKRGKHGVLVARGAQRLDVKAEVVKAVDTTGAGDLWASGFLYGLNHGLNLENAALLGCKVGSEVVQVMGAVIPDSGWQRVHAFRDRLAPPPPSATDR